MTPHEFIKKWKPVALTERAAAQSHFNDLCALFGHDDPISADPTGEWFAFEKGVTKTGGGEGFADVWKRGYFAWEYKKKKVSLDKALEQLVRYAAALENPPLQVACDTDRFLIRTAWTNAVPEEYEIALDDLAEPAKLDMLRSVFFDPEKLRPKTTRAGLTREAADKFSTIALRLQGAGTPEEIAHFVNQLVFCFFANSAELLPKGFFPKLLKRASQKPERARDYFNQLFAAMETGGEFDLTDIAWFNGGLFDGRRALKLDSGDIGLLQAAATLDWSQIDPTIFGTLFERFLDPQKRKQIGAHYTDPEKIMMIVEPVILRPLREEWAAAQAEIEGLLTGAAKPPKGMKKRPGMSLGETAAEEVRARYLERLKKISILDPACGSGNFLYLALQGVKDLENRANLECEALGLPPRVNEVGPEILHGIEINPVAAELARTAIWIGEIQWRRRNGIYYDPPPILRKLDTIECRDALIEAGSSSPPWGEAESERSSEPGEGTAANTDAPPPHPLGSRRVGLSPGGERKGASIEWREAPWPAAEFIVGNPPFLGGKLLRKGLGDDNVEALFEVFEGRVPPEADLVTYWFEKARAQLRLGKAKRAGLVATNSIRGGANRRVLERVAADAPLFEAWSDEPWIVEGAAVRVSLVCFGDSTHHPYAEARTERASNHESDAADPSPFEAPLRSAPQGEGRSGRRLNGLAVSAINTDLTSGGSDLTKAKRLAENAGAAFMGITKSGPFDVPSVLARAWLLEPLNPHGQPNSRVLRRSINGQEITRRPSDRWLLNLELYKQEGEIALFASPYEHAKAVIFPDRQKSRTAKNRTKWWRYERPRPEMYEAVGGFGRYIGTSMVAKHRLFVFVPSSVVPENLVIVIARDDDPTFGILHSRFHETWSLRLGTWLGVGNDPRYTPTTTFETFPFPEGLTPNIPAADYADDPRAIAIAEAAKRLDELRNAWLNPPDLVRIEPEVTPTAAPGEEPVRYPDRILPRNAEAAAKLKERTLTKLYNARPQWLADAHRDLDAAVAAAYGWPADISEEDALAKLLELNLERSAQQDSEPAVTSPLRGGRERRKPLREGVTAKPSQPAPLVGRESFAKISEVEGIYLDDEARAMFADFDRRNLTPEERRRAIIEQFRREAAE